MLVVSHLTKSFGGLMAVNDVGISVVPGELVGVIGPNGSGKTTLFNLLTGFLAPTSGDIHFESRSVAGLAPERLARMGMARTFQAVRFHKESTVRETVWAAQSLHLSFAELFAGPRSRSQTALREEVDRILGLTWLTPHAERLARELPFGLVRQLEIARALATHPKLLLMDEPASGMNPAETAKLSADIKRLNETGLTIILIEHDIEMVMGLCRRLIVLNYGKVIAEGSPQEVRRNPEVVKAYLGSKAAAHA